MPAPLIPLLLALGAGAFVLSKSHGAPPAGGSGMPAVFDPNMSPQLAQSVKYALDNGTDPAQLEALAAQLMSQGYPIAAAALKTKAMALRASQTVSNVAQNVQSVMQTSPGWQPQPPNPVQTVATATQVQQTAQTIPAGTPAAAAATQAAATAAQAATVQSPGIAQAAAVQAAAAAQQAQSAPALAQAAQAAATAQQAAQAAQAGNPQAAAVLTAAAAHQAVTAAQTAVNSAAAASQNQPAPTQQVPDAHLQQLALAAAAEIRSKGCWHEDRTKVTAFQAAMGGTKTVKGKAGVADGYYGPDTALAMMAYMPKVPQPCYWPAADPARSKAQADWKALVASGKVTVGANPIYVGGAQRYAGTTPIVG